jgi:hypothetical protein
VNRLVTALMDAAWKVAMLGLLAIGVQAVGRNQPAAQTDQAPVTEAPRSVGAKEQRGDPAARNRQVVVQQDKATDHVPEPQAADSNVTAAMVAMTYGPNGAFITLEEYYRRHPDARSYVKKPRSPWLYRPPTPRITPAQIAWVRMLPNYDGLRMRGLSDQAIIENLAPNDVKALEGTTVPEHLRPDLDPAIVFVNQRCADGTCRTGYCEASRQNRRCENGVCPVPRR